MQSCRAVSQKGKDGIKKSLPDYLTDEWSRPPIPWTTALVLFYPTRHRKLPKSKPDLTIPIDHLSRLKRLWYFSSTVNSFFKRACAAIRWGYMSDFGRTLRLLPYFKCANSEGSGETARMRRLAWAFASRLCDKYHNLMSWLILKFTLTKKKVWWSFITLNLKN